MTSSEGSASDVGRTFSESGSEPHDQQSVLSDPDSTGAPRTRGSGSGDSRPPSFQYVYLKFCFHKTLGMATPILKILGPYCLKAY